MDLSQYIYTSTLNAALPPKLAYDASCISVNACEQMGLTGRVFANRQQALAIIEGPSQLVEHYYQAVSAGPMVETILLHVKRVIPAREFEDYLIFLNLGVPFTFGDKVRKLTPGTARAAMPAKPSPRLRVMVEAYMDDYLTDYPMAG